jgi:murein DD-endopeptidase / murein LD-carboxypeptidase
MIDLDTRKSILRAARAAQGTKWQHQGRHAGLGLDCIGLALLAAAAGGENMAQVPHNYGIIPNAGRFLRFMQKNLVAIKPDEVLPGDLVLVCWKSYPMHVGVVADQFFDMKRPYSMIHANAGDKKVVEQPLDHMTKVHGFYRFQLLAAREA